MCVGSVVGRSRYVCVWRGTQLVGAGVCVRGSSVGRGRYVCLWREELSW